MEGPDGLRDAYYNSKKEGNIDAKPKGIDEIINSHHQYETTSYRRLEVVTYCSGLHFSAFFIFLFRFPSSFQSILFPFL